MGAADVAPAAMAISVTCPDCGAELQGLHHGDDPDEGAALLLRGHRMAREDHTL